MERESYLQALWNTLAGRMPREELERVMRYYEEYFDEAGPQREAEIIAELGAPEALAAQVMGERAAGGRGGAAYRAYAPRKGRTGVKIALVICLSPLWLPLVAACFAVALAVAAGGVACVAAGGCALWCAFTALFAASGSTLLFFVGMGFFTAALGLLLTVGGIVLCSLCGKGLVKLLRRAFGGRARQEAQA